MVHVDRKALLDQELARIAIVLADASFERYAAAVDAVTQAIESMPDDLPEWQDSDSRIYRITKNTDAARACNPNAGTTGLLPSSAHLTGAIGEIA